MEPMIQQLASACCGKAGDEEEQKIDLEASQDYPAQIQVVFQNSVG